MENTVVYVMFSAADARYVFPIKNVDFLKMWDNHICGIGYFTGIDVKGNTIIINPNQCGIIKIGSDDGTM